MKEEERKELEKQKKKDKKKNAKLKHIAEKEGVTVDELKERHQAENEAKKAEEDRAKIEEEERIAREHAAMADEERRRREIRERAIREQEQSESTTVVATARKAASQKSVKFAEDPVQALPKQQATLVETQFTHVKVKKPEEREQVDVQTKVEEVKNSSQTEPIKQALKPKENELSRKQRKTQDYIKSIEQRKKDGLLGPEANPTEEEKQEDIPLKATDEVIESSSDDEICGLSAEHKMKTMSTKARQRFRRKLKEEEDKERAEKDRVKKLIEEREAEKVRKEQEEA